MHHHPGLETVVPPGCVRLCGCPRAGLHAGRRGQRRAVGLWSPRGPCLAPRKTLFSTSVFLRLNPKHVKRSRKRWPLSQVSTNGESKSETRSPGLQRACPRGWAPGNEVGPPTWSPGCPPRPSLAVLCCPRAFGSRDSSKEFTQIGNALIPSKCSLQEAWPLEPPPQSSCKAGCRAATRGRWLPLERWRLGPPLFGDCFSSSLPRKRTSEPSASVHTITAQAHAF